MALGDASKGCSRNTTIRSSAGCLRVERNITSIRKRATTESSIRYWICLG